MKFSIWLGLILAMAGALRGVELVTEKWTVEELERQALVHWPDSAKDTAAPLVFVFHGHGGNAANVARSFALHTLWPEAIVVYPQGVPTPGRLTDPEGKKTGWQGRKGDVGDRDLKFFDAMMAGIPEKRAVDRRRIYTTGHSNGGGFSYLLWAERGEVLAALAPSAAIKGRGDQDTPPPRPVLHIAGEKDPLVKFEWQQATIAALRKAHKCGPGERWQESEATLYPSELGAPVVTLIHPGGHEFLKSAPPVIVRFFQAHALPEK